MSKATLVPADASTPTLGPAIPRRRGAGGIESLTSYIARIALQHRCSPYTLFSTVLIPVEERLNHRWKRVRFGESQLINSYGAVAHASAKAVSDCAFIPDAERMTYAGLERLCDPAGKHFLHPSRPWCPQCYLEARTTSIPAWDALYTYPRTSTVCTWHRKLLMLLCQRCERGQRYLPKFPFLDFCEHCGADLARKSPSKLEESSLEPALWAARAAMDIISAQMHEEDLSAKHFANNVSRLMSLHFRGLERPFAIAIGIAGSSPKNWIKRASAPTWASLVDLAYKLDIPPAHLGSPQAELTDPRYWRAGTPQALDRRHARPPPDRLSQIRAALRQRLVSRKTDTFAPPQGLIPLARSLGVSVGVLLRRFPTECEELKEQRREIMSLRKAESDREKAERLQRARAVLSVAGKPATVRNLKKTGIVKVSDIVTPRRLVRGSR